MDFKPTQMALAAHYFARFDRQLRRALKHAGDRWTVDQVFAKIADDRAQIWFTREGFAVSTIETAMSGIRYGQIWLVVGKLDDEMKELAEKILQFFRDAGATEAECTARLGWGRRWHAQGFKRVAEVWRAQL